MKAAGAQVTYEETADPKAQHLFDQLDETVEMGNMYDFLAKQSFFDA